MLVFNFLVAIRSAVSLRNIIRSCLRVGCIKRHTLVELWKLMALFRSKIFECERSADEGLFNSERL